MAVAVLPISDVWGILPFFFCFSTLLTVESPLFDWRQLFIMQNYAFLSALEQSIVKINLLTLASLNGLVCWCDDMPAVRRGSNALESQIFFPRIGVVTHS